MAKTDVVNTAEAANILGVDRATVVRWASSGQIKATKLPGQTGAFVYQRSDVEKLAAKRGADGSAA